MADNNDAKILIFDIESSSLNASFGITLCIGYMWWGEKEAKVLSIADYKEYEKDRINDKPLLEDFKKIMEEADMWVTWYGSKFDVPFLQTRMLYQGVGILPSTPHVDLLFHSRSKLRMHSNRLAAVSEFFGLGSKTAVRGDHWVRAIAGYKESLEYVIQHCAKDVLVLMRAYKLMRPLVRMHPRVKNWTACRVCGSTDMQNRGKIITKMKGTYQRVRCNKCGSWEQRSIQHVEDSGLAVAP